MTTNKYVFFNTIAEAGRFASLYGGLICKDSFATWKFGEKVNGKPYVFYRCSKEDIKYLKSAIGLKEKKLNNRVCYFFE